MTQPALIAQITGQAYHHMLDWRNEVDLKIIQEQLDIDDTTYAVKPQRSQRNPLSC